MPTAVSHLCEQFVRVILILGFTYFLFRSGAGAYLIGSGAAYGSFFGGAFGIVVLIIITNGTSFRQLLAPWNFNFIHMFRKNKSLFIQSGFICLSALVLILFQLIDAFTLVRFLQWFGLSMNEAVIMKGVYDRGQPLIQLGTVLTTTFSLALVPLLSKAVIKREMALAQFYQHLSYRLTLLVSGAAAVGLIVIMKPTNHMLFTDTAGSYVLSVLALAICFHSLFTTLTAVLQGYHLVKFPAKAVVIGLLTKLGGNLLFIPLFGVGGAAWSTISALIVMVVYLFIVLQLEQRLSLGKARAYVSIAALLIIMGGATLTWRLWVSAVIGTESRVSAMAISLSTVLVGAVAVIICVIVLPVFTAAEWKHIPVLNRLYVKIKKKG